MEAEGNELKPGPVVLSPVDRPEEVAPLIDAGADELYGGVIPDGWSSAEVAVNRRSFPEAQFPDESSFAEAVRIAAGRVVPLHLTLNAPFYHPNLIPDLMNLVDRALEWGVASLIVGDPGLMARVKRDFPSACVTLSTMAGAMNREAFAFYRKIGLHRAVLPRHLTLSEMGSIVRRTPGVEFEAFVLIGKCPNEEAFCTFQHVSADKRWPCESRYEISVAGSGREPDPGLPQVAARLRWLEADRRMGCGLCAIARLKELGVRIFKLVGRGGPTRGKVANVRLARKYADMEGEADAREDYLARFGRRCVRELCYFPELFPN